MKTSEQRRDYIRKSFGLEPMGVERWISFQVFEGKLVASRVGADKEAIIKAAWRDWGYGLLHDDEVEEFAKIFPR